jgi:hypothetical protein
MVFGNYAKLFDIGNSIIFREKLTEPMSGNNGVACC